MRALLWVLVIGFFLVGIGSTTLAVVLSISLARKGDHRPRSTWSSSRCRVLAAVAFVLAAVPVGLLAFLPTGSSSTTTSGTLSMTSTSGVTTIDWTTATDVTAHGPSQITSSTASYTLIEREGSSVLWVLGFPVLVCGLGAAIRGRWEHPVRIACGWALVAGSILALMSIGLLFLPAAAALTIAGALTPSAGVRSLRRELVPPA